MKRRRKLLSLLLSLALAVSMIPAFGVTASAESPLPNFKIENGVISWDHVKGADEYGVSGLIKNARMAIWESSDDGSLQNKSAYKKWTDTGVEFRLKDFLDNEAVCLPGTYNLTITAYRHEEPLGYRSSCSYTFDGTITQLQAPKALKWHGTTISWDPVPNATRYDIYFYENDTFVRSFTASGTSYTLNSELFINSEAYAYQYNVRARADGYVDSDVGASEKVSGASILGGYDSAGGSVRVSGGSAEKGDNVGILLSADTGIKTPKGSALVNEGSSLKSSPGEFVGTVNLNNSFKKEFLPGSTFQVYWSGYDVTAMLVKLNGAELKQNMVREGVSLTIKHPAVLYVGQELTIREGGRTYGTFTVTGIR